MLVEFSSEGRAGRGALELVQYLPKASPCLIPTFLPCLALIVPA
jgi:hypothetical protein